MNRSDELAEMQSLGARIRLVRIGRGLTLKEVAKATGLSSSFLSKLENGKVNISVNTLKTVASVLNVSMAALFDEAETLTGRVVTRKERLRLPSHDPGSFLELLVSRESRLLEVVYWDINAGFTSSMAQPHEGEEFAYVLSGTLSYHVGADDYVLEPGDAIFHRADVLHWWSNTSTGRTTCLMVEVHPPR